MQNACCNSLHKRFTFSDPTYKYDDYNIQHYNFTRFVRAFQIYQSKEEQRQSSMENIWASEGQTEGSAEGTA